MIHSCQPAEFVIPNGGSVREGDVPPEAEENGAHLIAAGGCTVSTELGAEKIKRIFIIRKQNSSFGNSHFNFDSLIITKNSGGLAAMMIQKHSTKKEKKPQQKKPQLK